MRNAIDAIALAAVVVALCAGAPVFFGALAFTALVGLGVIALAEVLFSIADMEDDR